MERRDVVRVLKLIFTLPRMIRVGKSQTPGAQSTDEQLVVGDFVAATNDNGDVRKNAVGLVNDVTGADITIHFIGIDKKVQTTKNDIRRIDISSYAGRNHQEKICNRCHIIKNASEFEKNRAFKTGDISRPSCRTCRRDEIDRIPLSKAGRKQLDSNRPKDFSVFTCPICRKRAIVGVTVDIKRDHDHTTGNPREWICDSCNTGLGRFGDNPEVLQRAIDYLKKHSEETKGKSLDPFQKS